MLLIIQWMIIKTTLKNILRQHYSNKGERKHLINKKKEKLVYFDVNARQIYQSIKCFPIEYKFIYERCTLA